jgi:acetyl-CoA carboxylase carboxyl transferase subunit alpha
MVLPFEKPVVGLLTRIAEVRALAVSDQRLLPELERLERETVKVVHELYSVLTPIQRVQLARHPNRPYTLDYVERLFGDWVELKGDRRFAEDAAIVGGLASYRGRSVVVLGHQKGRSTKDNLKRNFGMSHPEGYRKAMRLVELAGRFGLPIFTFVDTPGAYPGIGAEERGQSEAIGAAIAAMAKVPVPVIVTITGEGGSGGALGLAIGNRVFAMEFSFYSVISPEGCASILWRDSAFADEAAKQLKITAPDLLRLGIVEAIVPEPPGGAHQDHELAARLVDAELERALVELERLSPAELVDQRYDRFRRLGQFSEE